MRAKASGIVTNPIHKRALYEAGLQAPGHTEYLAARTGGATPVMMLSCPGLRVVPVTVHEPLKAVAALLTTAMIVEKGVILARALKRDLGLAHPRIAVAGLNPHAGEEGHIGREEIEIIAPAIEAIRREGVEVSGPLPPDTMFHAAARARYDAALCMYHDQALIPIKTIDFERGVNTTLGLPIVRTSPDHGTALDIAGRGAAQRPEPHRGDPARASDRGQPRAMSDGLPPLRDVIARHGLAAQKALGQNFLLDLNLTGRIARAAGSLADHHIVEVGPGPGGLTRALLAEGARHVTVIERDKRCLPALEEIAAAYPGRLTIVEGDALETDMAALVDGPARIVANLPYNIATPLLIGWLQSDRWPPWYASLTLMFQKEVAERIVAAPGSKAYGRLAVASQWRTRARMLFDIDRRAFTPPPSITSTVVELIPRAEPLAPADPRALETVVAAAFGQRRKMLRSSLRSLTADAQSILDAAAIDGTRRAEELTVEEFCALARAFKSRA